MANGQRTAAALAALHSNVAPIALGIPAIGLSFQVPGNLIAAAGFAVGGGELPNQPGINSADAVAGIASPPQSFLQSLETTRIAGIPLLYVVFALGVYGLVTR